MPNPRSWSDEDLRDAVEKSTSWRQVHRHLGLCDGGSSRRTIKEEAARLGLDTSRFTGKGWRAGTGNGRNVEAQRAAKRRWYEQNRGVYREKNAKRRKELAEFIKSQKDVPCADCGKKYPYFIMEFDHRDGEVKAFNIGRGASAVSRARLLEEMAKCDVVCVCCHRYRTARRSGWDEDVLAQLPNDD